ncbi:MAG TPA: hypothetical protein VNS63_11840 [Blastocatellia bacterium]|nr:hypothetical protein [Blastocatellia bacterium]
MKRTVPKAAALFLVAVLTYVTKAEADNPHFTTIDFPGAGLTVANEVNENGEIVGFYRLALPSPPGALGPFRGFLLSNGQFTTIHVPGAARTRAFGIDNAGDIVGDYFLSGVNYGFLLKAGSNQFQTIRYTNTNFAAAFTDSWGIDEQGNVTGGFNNVDGNMRAYVWRDGAFTKILEVPSSLVTYTHGLNAKGEIVGCYFPDPTSMHSLRVTADGTYLIEDFPGSMMSMHWRISESSIIVGHYIDMDGVNHGYLYKDGGYDTIDFPGSTFTQTHGIAEIEQFNRNGDPLGTRQLLIVGPYDDSNGKRHGFLLTRRVGVGHGEAP